MHPKLLQATDLFQLFRFLLVCRAAVSSPLSPPFVDTNKHGVTSCPDQDLNGPAFQAQQRHFCFCCAGPVCPHYGLHGPKWLCQIKAAASSLVRVSVSWAVPALQEECEVCRARQADRVAQDIVGGSATSHVAQVGAEAEEGGFKPALQKGLLPALLWGGRSACSHCIAALLCWEMRWQSCCMHESAAADKGWLS